MKFFLLALLTLLCWYCQRKTSKHNEQASIQTPLPKQDTTVLCPGDMLENATDTIPPILFSPPNREDVCGWWMPEDTITPNGNFVKYLISNDTCCRDYLYLKWGNSNLENTDNLGQLRQFNPRMTPEYVAESDKYIFLEGAASGGMPMVGWNLWVLPLANHAKSAVYTTLSQDAYDLQSMTVVREVYDAPGNYPILEAYNIRTQRTKPIRLKHRISAASASWAVDSISITPRNIFLRIGVLNEQDDMVDETIVLPNDIK